MGGLLGGGEALVSHEWFEIETSAFVVRRLYGSYGVQNCSGCVSPPRLRGMSATRTQVKSQGKTKAPKTFFSLDLFVFSPIGSEIKLRRLKQALLYLESEKPMRED